MVPVAAGNSPDPTTDGTEIAELRTRTSRTFDLGDNTYRTEVSTDSLNYRDANGSWQRVDNDLVASDAPGFSHQNAANRYRVHFPRSAEAPVRVSLGAHWITFSLDEAGPGDPAVSDNAITYSDVLPGVSLTYTAQSDGIKEDLILEGPSAPSSFSYRLKTSPGLSAAENEAGGIDFSSDGELEFSFAPPFMYDSAEPPARSDAVTLTLQDHPGAQTLTLTADETWLQEDERVWPVVVDPTITLNKSASPACTIHRTASWETGMLASQDCGNIDVGRNERALLGFDLGTIPASADITSTDLSLNGTYYTEPGVTPGLNLHRVTTPWKENTTLPCFGLNWFNTGYGSVPDDCEEVKWTTPGGDFDPVAAATTVGPAGDGLIHFSPTTVVRSWVNSGTANNGFLLKMIDEVYPNTAWFNSASLKVVYETDPLPGQDGDPAPAFQPAAVFDPDDPAAGMLRSPINQMLILDAERAAAQGGCGYSQG